MATDVVRDVPNNFNMSSERLRLLLQCPPWRAARFDPDTLASALQSEQRDRFADLLSLSRLARNFDLKVIPIY